jgi:HEAT repeat protein
MLWWKKLKLAMGSQEKKLDMLQRLADSRDPGAVDVLIEALKDRDGKVPLVAAEGLGKLRDARAVPPLMVAFRDKDDYICWAAAEALGKIGGPAVDPLIAALDDPNTAVRTLAARTLGQIGVQAIGPLADTLRRSTTVMREAAVEALSNIRDEKAVQHLLAALSDRNESVRDKAARALVNIGKVAVPGLLQLLNQVSQGEIRQRAMWALERLGAEPLTETYIRPVAHGKWKDVGRVDTDNLLALTAALKEPDKKARATAIQTLANIGDERAVPGLGLALTGPDRDLRDMAIHALVKIGPAAVPALLEMLKHGSSDLRPRVADVLGYIADARALEPLRTALTDPDPSLRSAAVEALPAFKDPTTVQPLLTLLRDPDPRVRFSAVGAVWQFDDRRAVEPLLDLLSDPDRPTQTRAIQALGNLGDERCLEPLLVVAKRSRAVRLEAGLAIAKINPQRAIAPLVAMSLDDPDMCGEAVEILTEVLETAAASLTPADLESVANLPDNLEEARLGLSPSVLPKMPVDAGPMAQLAVDELVRRGLREPAAAQAQAQAAAGGEARSCSRQPTREIRVHILHGMHQAEPISARAIDISAGGLGLIAKGSYNPGTLLTVRPADAPPEVPWVLVELRHAQPAPGGWRLGCKFVRSPSYAFHVFFGQDPGRP